MAFLRRVLIGGHHGRRSAFIGALVWGEKRLGPHFHFLAALAVARGRWLSAPFILVTNAFMQHPVGYRTEADGSLFPNRTGQLRRN
jgi:cytochrome bd-type quinol oxidase subunit 1